MHWIRQRAGFPGILLFAASLVLNLQSSESKKLTVYASKATFNLDVVDIGSTEYASVFDLLEPLANIQERVSGNTYKISIKSVEGTFTEGETEVRIGHSTLQLSANIVIDHGRVLVPIHVLPTILQQFINVPCEFHEATRRLFIGTTAIPFTAEVKHPEERLLLSFSSPVKPVISSENSSVHLLFTHDPVTYAAESLSLNDKVFTRLNFLEHNGDAEIIVTGTCALTASLSNGGKTITISGNSIPKEAPNAAIGGPPAPGGSNAGQVTAALAPTSPQVKSGAATRETAVLHFFVMIDPAHGGTDTGARFSDKTLEKDITLSVAHRLRNDLQERGISAVLLRDGDVTMSLDQRATTGNAQRAGLYVSIHAGAPGSGVRVYTAMLPDPPPTEKGTGPFAPWESAQQKYLARSKVVADAVISALGVKQINSMEAVAPLPPLNNIVAPAFAVELTPPDRGAPDSLNRPNYQQAVATAIANAIASTRGRTGENR